ncbi:MAG: hypothetical protein U0174_10405 [Polyangiaceae bacterium]
MSRAFVLGLLGAIALITAGACSMSSPRDGQARPNVSPQLAARVLAERDPHRVFGRALAHSRFEGEADQPGAFRSRGTMAAIAGKRAAEGVRFLPHAMRSLAIDVRLLEASDAAATEEKGVVAYARALPGADLLVATEDLRGEEFLLLRDETAPSTFHWQFALPSGARGEARQDGLWLWDRRGSFLAHVPPPESIDAQGTTRREAWSWSSEKSEFTISLASRASYTFPVLLDPTFELEAWEDVSKPQDIDGQAVAFDAARQNLVVFGGASSMNMPSGTWLWDGTWKKPALATQPTRRTYAAMAYDEVHGKVLLYGGANAFSRSLGDTWTWDGQGWKEETPSVSPGPRTGANLAFDRKRGKLVLFGGDDLVGTFPSDTFMWDGAVGNWVKIATTHSPPGRAYGGFAYDPGTEKSYLVGGIGSSGTAKVETWAFDGTDWTVIPWSGQPPSNNAQGARLAYDDARNKLTMMNLAAGGETQVWAWNGAAWNLQATHGGIQVGFFPVIVSDRRVNRIVYWSAGSSEAAMDLGQFFLWDGSTFERDAGFLRPPRRRMMQGGALSNGQHLYVASEGGAVSTWLFDPVTRRWTLKTTPPALQLRGHSAVAYDSIRGEGILFSGTVGTPDTWIWDGTTWTQRFPGAAPPPRIRASFSFDPVRQVAWLFGGQPTTSGIFGDLWRWNGTTWSAQAVAGASPSPRFEGAMQFDPKRGVTVLFGGYAESGPSDETWTWDGQTWTEYKGTVRPSGRWGASLAWDDRSERLIMFGGQGTQNFNDTWAWDGITWKSLVDKDATVVPPARLEGMLVGLPGTGRMLLRGSESLLDEWLLHVRGGECTKGTDCGSGNCIDGACCESKACGTCETCAGDNPGICTPVRSTDDPDTCAAKDGKSCDATGQCKPTAGGKCTTDDDCATKHCALGVCCNVACDAPCEACAASAKLTGADDGRCGAAAIGSNPANRCGENSTCNALGACTVTTIATCQNDHELSREGDVVTDCTPYKCNPGASGAPAACLKRCSTANNCVFPATCSPDGRCEVRGPVEDDGGCSLHTVGSRGSAGTAGAMFVTVAVLAAFRRRQRRSYH